MLFQSTDALESEKERNLYSKIFAGYFFNELVPGYERRLIELAQLLKDRRTPTFGGPLCEEFHLAPESTRVTFDFHGYILDDRNDRGELADIFITDIKNRSAAAVEVKFLSNWNFEKDIGSASKRFESLLASEKISSFAHILLLTQEKLKAGKRATRKAGSNWAKLSDAPPEYPLVILTWEEIADCCVGPEGETVRHFLTKHLKETRQSLRERARNLLDIQ